MHQVNDSPIALSGKELLIRVMTKASLRIIFPLDLPRPYNNLFRHVNEVYPYIHTYAVALSLSFEVKRAYGNVKCFLGKYHTPIS